MSVSQAKIARDEAWEHYDTLRKLYPPGWKRRMHEDEVWRAFCNAEWRQIEYDNALFWASYYNKENA